MTKKVLAIAFTLALATLTVSGLSSNHAFAAGKSAVSSQKNLKQNLKKVSMLNDAPISEDKESKDKEMIDGKAFVQDMLEAADRYNDYSFNYTMKVYKKSKPIVEEGVFTYKKPGLIRLEETGQYKKGAVAVLGPDGKVRAHLGGMLKAFVAELPADSGMLRSANGHPMVQSDFKSLAKALKEFSKDGVTTKVSKSPTTLEGRSESVYVLELYKEKLWKRVHVNSKTKLPAEWWDYSDSGKLWSYATWNSVKANQGIADNFFNVKGIKADIGKLSAGDQAKLD
jgi:outer membrane lipoprotein-sorting protein